jgi:hypothetical protein
MHEVAGFLYKRAGEVPMPPPEKLTAGHFVAMVLAAIVVIPVFLLVSSYRSHDFSLGDLTFLAQTSSPKLPRVRLVV